MALLCVLVLVSSMCTLHAHLPLQAATKLPELRADRHEELSAQIRDALELAREREQILAAQTSIADWQDSLRQHRGTHRSQQHEAEKLHNGQRPHRRRRKRAEHNDLYGKDPPNSGKNGTEGLEPEDVDDVEASVVCYGPLGCFHETDHLPEMLPSSPAEVNTRFLVYTTMHRSEKPLIEFSYEELVDAAYGAAYRTNDTDDFVTLNSSIVGGMSSPLLQTFGDLNDRTVRVIVHGFGANCGLVWIYEMRTALMAVENCTVICVDWENGAKLPNYVRAAANTRLVGRQLALLLRLLRMHNRLRLSRVHLIGFSLGSHVAGFAGAEFSTARKPTTEDDVVKDSSNDEMHGEAEQTETASEAPETTGLWRITGLDPAGPLFEAQPPDVRLDASDAGYVDVIHSNGENLILGGLGSWQPMGTVDYYPNGGRVQHGCTNLFVGAVTDIIWAPPTTVEGRSLCNHRRAYKFFIDSVAPRCHFPAFPCESYDKFATGECFECAADRRNGTTNSACGHMGYYATSRDVGGYGQLYLRTRDEEPYCANQFRLRLRNAPDELPLRTVGRFELTLEGGDTGNGVGEGGIASDDGRGPVTLITFNETFHLDETREDREFHAGQWLTTILVPHPALGHRPRALIITYRPYRGGWWQRSSVGKQLWRIGPILLTADDHNTYGSCDILTLQADVPVRIELAQVQLTPKERNVHDHEADSDDEGNDDDEVGDCRVMEPQPIKRPAKITGKVMVGGNDEPSGAKSSIEELVQPGRHDRFSWTPMAISIPRQTHHHPDGSHVNEKRSFSESALHPLNRDPEGQLVLPLEGGTGSDPVTTVTTTTTTTSTTLTVTTGPGGGIQTVQLFPSRLVSFFERAERYARRTWDALFNGNGTADLNDSSTMTSTMETGATTSSSVMPMVAVPLIHRTAQWKTGSPPPASSTSVEDTVQPTASSTEIRIALPTFRPLARSTAEGSVSSSRQHYNRFIPLVYEEEKNQPASVRQLPRKNDHEALATGEVVS